MRPTEIRFVPATSAGVILSGAPTPLSKTFAERINSGPSRADPSANISKAHNAAAFDIPVEMPVIVYFIFRLLPCSLWRRQGVWSGREILR